MSAEHATARFRVTLTESGDRLRLEALAQPDGEPVGARETGLLADLDAGGRARALQLVARRLDRAVVRDEDLDALMDGLARVRLNRAGVVAMPRSVRRAPAALNTNTRGDKHASRAWTASSWLCSSRMGASAWSRARREPRPSAVARSGSSATADCRTGPARGRR